MFSLKSSITTEEGIAGKMSDIRSKLQPTSPIIASIDDLIARKREVALIERRIVEELRDSLTAMKGRPVASRGVPAQNRIDHVLNTAAVEQRKPKVNQQTAPPRKAVGDDAEIVEVDVLSQSVASGKAFKRKQPIKLAEVVDSADNKKQGSPRYTAVVEQRKSKKNQQTVVSRKAVGDDAKIVEVDVLSRSVTAEKALKMEQPVKLTEVVGCADNMQGLPVSIGIGTQPSATKEKVDLKAPERTQVNMSDPGESIAESDAADILSDAVGRVARSSTKVAMFGFKAIIDSIAKSKPAANSGRDVVKTSSKMAQKLSGISDPKIGSVEDRREHSERVPDAVAATGSTIHSVQRDVSEIGALVGNTESAEKANAALRETSEDLMSVAVGVARGARVGFQNYNKIKERANEVREEEMKRAETWIDFPESGRRSEKKKSPPKEKRLGR